MILWHSLYLYIMVPLRFPRQHLQQTHKQKCNTTSSDSSLRPQDSERDILVTRVYFKSFQIDLVYALEQLFCSSSLQLKSTVFF